jgi:uncharacterized MAPEG superfamily protein
MLVTLMPVLVVGYAKSGGTYDNHKPREGLDRLEAKKRRAYDAHLNCYEALPVFIAALFVAVWTEAPEILVDGLAAAFVLFRILYVLAYITNQATLRSAVWSLAYLCAIGLFISGLWPHA